MKSLTERLRYTASRGTSVWGDLQVEAADEIERLEAENASFKKLLRVIAYPHLCSDEELMDIFQAADLIRADFTSEELESVPRTNA